MKRTMRQVEERMTAAWGQKAVVVPYRLSGNRYAYVVTDHGDHWLSLYSSWEGGHQVFELVGVTRSELGPKSWAGAVLDASQLAQAYFTEQGNNAALKRLPRAMTIAETQLWTRLEDELDTWLIPSSTNRDVLYHVNGRCTCPDCQMCLRSRRLGAYRQEGQRQNRHCEQ